MAIISCNRREFLLGAAAAGAGLLTSVHGRICSGAQQPASAGGRREGENSMVQKTYSAAVMQTALQGFSDVESDSERIRKNIQTLADHIRRVVTTTEPRPLLIVLPVLSFTGIGNAQSKFGIQKPFIIEQVAVDLTHDSRLEPVRKVCAQNQCYVASTCVEKVKALPGRYFHTGFVLGPDGLVLRSPKVQAATSAGITLLQDFYDAYIRQFGTDAILPVADTPLGRLGCVVANEFLVPEAARVLAKKGAEIIVHPTFQREGPGQPPYDALMQTQAYTNGTYWLSAAPSREIITVEGKQLEEPYGGGSCIIGPDASVAAAVSGSGEGFVTARIDMDHLLACREKNAQHTTPAFGIYGKLYSQ